MDEFGAALQFFQGFGENWWALSDCLSRLDEWLPAAAYVLVVEQAEDVLADQSDQLIWLLKTLDETGTSWSRPVTDGDIFDRPAIPFHTLLHFSEGNERVLEDVRSLARSNDISLRN